MFVILFEGRPATAEDIQALSLYNYGSFTSMRVENGRVRGLSMHMDRLVHDSSMLFGTPVDPNRVRSLIRQAMEGAQGSFVVRVTVYAPDIDFGRPSDNRQPKILITARPALPPDSPSQAIATGVFERDLPTAKHVGLFGQILQRREAQLAGFDDVVFLDSRGAVTEGATWNIGFVRIGGQVTWPDSSHLIGVTMRIVQGILGDLGVDQVTEHIDKGAIGTFIGAFTSNASLPARPIRSIDDVSYATDLELFEKISRAYWAMSGDTI